MLTIIMLIVAYLIGSLSTSIILSKLMKFPDPRGEGSGNAGATNVLRTVGKHKAAMVLAGDLLKGLIAVLLARIFGVSGAMLAFVALAAVLGHVFPLYFKFQGGKGVATAIGAIIALSFWVGIIVAATWIVVAFIFRYASLASLAAIGLSIIYMLVFGTAAYAFPVLCITALIIWKHMDNINRLRAGTESKMDFKL